MAECLSVARPYAKSIYELAQTNSRLQSWEVILKILAGFINDPEAKMILKNPTVDADQVVKFLTSLMPEEILSDEELKQQLVNFIRLLCENKRLNVLLEINTLFQQFMAEYKNSIKVEVISAFPINEKQRQQLSSALSQRFQKNINLDYQINEALIGGAIIRSGNWTIDGSVRGKLQRLHEELVGWA